MTFGGKVEIFGIKKATEDFSVTFETGIVNHFGLWGVFDYN